MTIGVEIAQILPSANRTKIMTEKKQDQHLQKIKAMVRHELEIERDFQRLR